MEHLVDEEFDRAFEHDYKCELLKELPNGATPYYYPGATTVGGKDGLIVRIQPRLAAPWIGIFEFGYGGGYGLFSWPDASKLFVLSRGRGYLVQTPDPRNYKEIEVEPITAVVLIPERSLVVIADYTELKAFGPLTLEWTTKQLSWDGIKITDTDADSIEGDVWEPRIGSNVSFRVSLVDGSHEGGIEM
jgi:hypothetical protein